MIQKEEVCSVARARGLAVMTPRLHRVDRGFDSHRAHLKSTATQCACFTNFKDPKTVLNHRDFLTLQLGHLLLQMQILQFPSED